MNTPVQARQGSTSHRNSFRFGHETRMARVGWWHGVLALFACHAVACAVIAAEAERRISVIPFDRGPVRIVCLGDSVTGVYYHTGGVRAYPEMLEVALRRALPSADVSVINAGISGHTTQNGLERLERDVLRHRPHLVTISFCLNDVARIAPEQFRVNLRTLATRCRDAGASVILCTPNAVLETGARPATKIEAYCEILRDEAARLQVPVCDQYRVGTSHRALDPHGWRTTLSDEIHPNMDGHKRMAEELCRVISGQTVSLSDERAPTPALAITSERVRAKLPVRVIAMPPYDAQITAALRAMYPLAEVQVTPWPIEGKSVAELEQAAKTLVRPAKPDLVVLAVPRAAATGANDEAFIRSFSWIMNHALSFGLKEWDCVAVHPSVAHPEETGPRDALVRQLILAQDLPLIDRNDGDKRSATELFAHRLDELARPERHAPVYADKANLLQYQDAAGRLQPVKSIADWRHRVRHLQGNLQKVMGPLPPPSTGPLDMRVVEETVTRLYTRRKITFAVEAGDRLSGYLLLPHATPAASAAAGSSPKSESTPNTKSEAAAKPGSTSPANAVPADRRPAMICLPGSSAGGKDHPAGLGPNADMAYGHELAERGYVCLVLDYPLLHTADYKTDPYALGYVSATMKGVVNHRRGVDLLASLPEVDPLAIGVVGHSLGGHNALFLAAFDERVRAVASSCGFNVFSKHAKGNLAAWSSRYYMPLIKTAYGDDPSRQPFDFTELLAALAPRAVFVNAPLHDAPDFEVSGVRDCVHSALPIFDGLFGAAERLEVHYPDAGHTFPIRERLALYAFLDRYLRRPATPGTATPATSAAAVDLKRGLVAHWPLSGDGKDVSGSDRHLTATALRFEPEPLFGAGRSVAVFDGRANFGVLPADRVPAWGAGEFSISTWMQVPKVLDDVPGDLLSQYGASQHKGLQLSLKSHTGVTFSPSNHRHLAFGIDADRSSGWVDCGRPGKALLAFALVVHEGALYAGTCEPGKDESGHVYRYAGGQKWVDCGAPDRCNAVTALGEFDGRLYAGVGKYRVAGSALAESENLHLGGTVYRYDGGTKWTACGKLAESEAVGGLVVFKGRLYGSSLYKPAGFFRYDGGQSWTECGVPEVGEKKGHRVEALGVFDGFLYATSYDAGRVFRFDGSTWTDCGALGDNTQTYSFAPYRGALHVGTWPSGRVYRMRGLNDWVDAGRLGEELEVMGMLVHNGRLIAGTLPLAEVYEYREGTAWHRLAQLDTTPDVKYRRAWTMAEHQGQLFVSTLPSGKVFAYEAGRSVEWGREFPDGWRHVAAVKRNERLALFLDGRPVAESAPFANESFDLTSSEPLYLGRGMTDFFRGRMSDVRLYNRALSATEVARLAKTPVSAHQVTQIVAHRGASAECPENTLASTRAAITSGATAVEVDVRTTRDGRLVLSHDAQVERSTDGKGLINELTFEELRKLDAGVRFAAKFKGERIPTLEEVLAVCKGKIDVLLDLKEAGDLYANRVVAAVRKAGDPARTIVGVRSVAQAREFRQRLPEARQIGLIGTPAEIEAYAEAGVEMIRLWPRWLTDPSTVARVKQARVQLHLNGTDGTPDELRELLVFHPDSISSDDPARAVRTLRELGVRE